MIQDYFSLAFGNLKHRGARSWLTMLGIFIGIAAVVSLISLGQGLETAITAQFDSLSTDRLVVTSASAGFGPPGSTAVKKLTSHDEKVIEQVGGVDLTVSRLIRIVKVEYNKISNFVYIGSLPTDKKKSDYIYNSLNVGTAEGRLLTLNDRGKVVLGHDFLDQQSFDKPIRIGTNLNIQGKNFEVVGFLEKASTFTLNSVILMNEDEMKDILNIGDEIDLIVVQVSSQDIVLQTAENIERAMRQDRNQKVGEEDFSVQSPAQALGSVKTILNIINLTVAGIAAISLLIGAIGIANTMFTSVLERTKEIGVMKSVGAQNKDILSIFLIESSLLGLVGGIVGAAIGLSMAFFVATAANGFFETQLITVSPSWYLLIGSVLLSTLLGIGSGLLPAFQASKLKPVDALRQ